MKQPTPDSRIRLHTVSPGAINCFIQLHPTLTTLTRLLIGVSTLQHQETEFNVLSWCLLYFQNVEQTKPMYIIIINV